MAVKKTIAIVGADEEKGILIASRLSAGNYRLLLLSNEPATINNVAEDIKRRIPNADVEMIGCMKDGCWEADIIIIATNTNKQKEAAGKIREVAIQKVVVCLADSKDALPFAEAAVQQLFPFSKVVAICSNAELAEVFITGNDDEAVKTVALMLGVASYG